MAIVTKAYGFGLLVFCANLWSADIDIYHQYGVLTAAALPLSSHGKGNNDNQIYIGMFRPNEHTPGWQGNLKLYQIGLSANTQKAIVVDAQGVPLIDMTSGLMNSGARSFWTSEDGSTDGTDVALGRVAQGLQGHVATHRIRFTCTGLCNRLEPFAANNTNLVATDFGVHDKQQMKNIINWAAGTSHVPAHGDVIHSRPEIINYGGTVGPYIFYGSNDGMVHAAKGGSIEKSVLTSASDGEKVWTFTAPEQFKYLTRLYKRQAAFKRGENVQDTFGKNPYRFDNPISSYLHYNSKNEIGNDPAGERSQAIIYLTASHGGNLIYALDVTDPLAPTISWHKTNRDSDFSHFDQTGSSPVVTMLNIGASSAAQGVPVLVMGLGHDAGAQDLRTPRSQGQGIIIINALSGEIIWHFAGVGIGATVSVPGNITVIDRNLDGFVDRIYFADTDSQLWRVNSQSADPNDWTANRLLTLPRGRKFFYSPDVVTSPDGSYDAVIIGSGDIGKPFDSSVQNYLVFYRDHDLDQSLGQSPIRSLDDLYEVTVDSGSLVFDAKNINDEKFLNGWYLKLAQGEKVVTRALTANNITVFATHVPCINNGCEGLGEARIYRIDPFAMSAKSTKEKAYKVIVGHGILPSPQKFTVTLGVQSCEGAKCSVKPKIVSGVLFGVHAEQFSDQGLGDRRKLWWYSRQDD